MEHLKVELKPKDNHELEVTLPNGEVIISTREGSNRVLVDESGNPVEKVVVYENDSSQSWA